jgi:hypothetical protein
MKIVKAAIFAVAGTLALSFPALPQGEKQGQGTAIVTILPKHDGDAAPSVSPQNLNLKVNGKEAQVTNLVPLQGANGGLELVVLLDSGSRNSLGNQMDEIAKFIKSLPPNAKSTIGYMENGRAILAGPLSADHDAVLRGLHITSGISGANGSPYFSLSDLANHWPSGDTAARREVVMVTDGVDEYNRRFDPDDPYVQAAMRDSVKAGLVVYTIYWTGRGRADSTEYANNTGQSLMFIVAEATGGKSFWEGMGNPVSFAPYFDELSRRFKNQYELVFTMPFNGKPQVEPMKLKFSAPGADVAAPQQVFVSRPAVAQN